jgi:hypothetical protein
MTLVRRETSWVAVRTLPPALRLVAQARGIQSTVDCSGAGSSEAVAPPAMPSVVNPRESATNRTGRKVPFMAVIACLIGDGPVPHGLFCPDTLTQEGNANLMPSCNREWQNLETKSALVSGDSGPGHGLLKIPRDSVTRTPCNPQVIGIGVSRRGNSSGHATVHAPAKQPCLHWKTSLRTVCPQSLSGTSGRAGGLKKCEPLKAP